MPNEVIQWVYTLTMFVTFYVLPLIIIGGCYTSMAGVLFRQRESLHGRPSTAQHQHRGRVRKRVARMVLVVVVVFALCWLPIHFVHLITDVAHVPVSKNIIVFKQVGHCLSYLNSVINPLIYSFMNKTFRKAFHSTLYCQKRKVSTTPRHRKKSRSLKPEVLEQHDDLHERHSKHGQDNVQKRSEANTRQSCCVYSSSSSDATDSWYEDEESERLRGSNRRVPCLSVVVMSNDSMADSSAIEESHDPPENLTQEQTTGSATGIQVPGSHSYVYPTSPTYGIYQLQELLAYMERTFQEKLANLPSTAV